MTVTDRPLPFLARENELERIHAAIAAARAGRGQLIFLRGPAGIGVSSLAARAADLAAGEGLAVLRGRSTEGMLGRAYGGIAGALAGFAAGQAADRLSRQLGADAAPVARVVPLLRSLLPVVMAPAPLEPADESLRLHAAVAGWLARAAAEQPLMIVLDDLQFADGDELRLLAYLAWRAGELPILILGGYSEYADTADDPQSANFWRAPSPLAKANTISLAGLDEAATATLLTGIAGEPVAPAVLAAIQQVSGGAPLLARELYLHLGEENRLPRPGADWGQAVGELPQTIDDVVAWRAARLPIETRNVLAVLALLHDGAPAARLAAVSGVSRARVIETLEPALAAGLAVPAELDGSYEIRHRLVRRALIDRLSALQRAQLHRRLAEVIEEEAGDRLREEAASLAHHHYASAIVPGAERGVSQCLLAAEQARSAYGFLREVHCLRRGLELVPAQDERAAIELRSRLALAEAEAGLAAEACASADESHLDEVIALLRAVRRDADPAVELPPAWHQLHAATLAGLPKTDKLNRARLDLLAEHWQPVAVAALAMRYWADTSGLAATALERDGNEADRAETMLPERPRTHETTAELLGGLPALRRPATVLRALRSATYDLVTRHGLYREAASWAAKYLAAAERYGSPRDEAAALLLLSRCQAVLGDFALARETLAAAEAALSKLDQPGQLTIEATICRYTLAHFTDGDWPAVRPISRRPRAATGKPAGLALAAEAAIAHERKGAEAEARDLVERLMNALAQFPPLTFYRDTALVATLSAAWELGAAEHAGAGRTLIGLAEAAGAGGQPYGTPGLTRARMAGLLGAVDAARQLFAAQRPLLEAAGLRPLRAICDHDEAIALAAAAPDAPRNANELLNLAAAAFEELAMPGWLERTRALQLAGFPAAAQPGGRLHFTYPAGLSRREADIVRLTLAGASASEIVTQLALDAGAAERHLAAALGKLGAAGPTELAQQARRHGLAPG
jgi:DNA-binding CsgD family transcriptional regulator